MAPRPLFVLAISQSESDDPLTYTLPTRVERKDTAQEMSQVVQMVWIFLQCDVVAGEDHRCSVYCQE